MESGLCIICNNRRQRCLAHARRTVEYQTAQPVGLEHPSKELVGPKEMALPDKLVESPRPHPHGQWRRRINVGLFKPAKQLCVVPVLTHSLHYNPDARPCRKLISERLRRRLYYLSSQAHDQKKTEKRAFFDLIRANVPIYLHRTVLTNGVHISVVGSLLLTVCVLLG